MNFELLNEMLRQAILHGGDTGGPWLSNTEDLEFSIHRFMSQFNIPYHIEWDEYYPHVVEGNKKGFNNSEIDMYF